MRLFLIKISRGFQKGSLFFFLITLLGCALFSEDKKQIVLDKNYSYHKNQDYIDHFSRLGTSFINSNKTGIVKLSKRSQKFLEEIEEKLRANNELVLRKEIETRFFVIKDNRPFHFSFPSGEIILSSSLVKNYIKTESLLGAVLALELIKQHNGIYKKNLIVPLGYLTYEDILPYLQLRLEDKEEVNKWTFYTLRRGGYDPLSLLKLIQIKNKNFLDFLSANETSDSISREETMLKSFLIRNKLIDSYNQLEKNSSPDFYSFLREVRQRA